MLSWLGSGQAGLSPESQGMRRDLLQLQLQEKLAEKVMQWMCRSGKGTTFCHLPVVAVVAAQAQVFALVAVLQKVGPWAAAGLQAAACFRLRGCQRCHALRGFLQEVDGS